MSGARAVLEALGEALGGPRWVQGPGGNVSVKADAGELWVKASGKRLADVAASGGHAVVPLALVRRALDGDTAADDALFAHTPRPSLETYFHALGGTVVAHVHAVGALLYACSSRPLEREILPGVFSIPYVRPGRGIALAVRDVLGDAREGVVVLRSHGVVAFADDQQRVVELLERFDAWARSSFADLPAFEPMVAEYTRSSVLAAQGVVFRELPSRSPRTIDPPRYLFPDAPVCASTVLVDTDPRDAALLTDALRTIGRSCVVTGPFGVRVAVARNPEQLEGTTEVVAAHDWVEDALVARGLVHYVPVDEPAALLAMPSEAYRIRLAGKS